MDDSNDQLLANCSAPSWESKNQVTSDQPDPGSKKYSQVVWTLGSEEIPKNYSITTRENLDRVVSCLSLPLDWIKSIISK